MIIYSLIFILYGCSLVPKGYTKYQTFDEYTLQGVTVKGKLKTPFVAIKFTHDTIFMLVYENQKQTQKLEYLNNISYWYSIKKEQIDPKLAENCKCDTTPRYIEKFIYNDTILEYSYYLERTNSKFSESLTVFTRNNNIHISPVRFNIQEKSKFAQLKEIVNNYKIKYPYSKPGYVQKSYYEIEYRFYKGDTVFVYENDGNPKYKIGYLRAVYVLNSLGEFGSKHNKNILYKVKKRDLYK